MVLAAEAEWLGSCKASEIVEAAAIRGVSLLDRGDIDAARLGRRLGDPRQLAWQEDALATARRCGMRALTSQLLQVSEYQELA